MHHWTNSAEVEIGDFNSEHIFSYYFNHIHIYMHDMHWEIKRALGH